MNSPVLFGLSTPGRVRHGLPGFVRAIDDWQVLHNLPRFAGAIGSGRVSIFRLLPRACFPDTRIRKMLTRPDP